MKNWLKYFIGTIKNVGVSKWKILKFLYLIDVNQKLEYQQRFKDKYIIK